MSSRVDGRLVLEPGCIRLRSWRLDVPATLEVADLASALVACGWADETRFAVLRELRHPDGHKVLLVPRTGRVQVRLDLGVPEPERERTAAAIAEIVLATIERLGGT